MGEPAADVAIKKVKDRAVRYTFVMTLLALLAGAVGFVSGVGEGFWKSAAPYAAFLVGATTTVVGFYKFTNERAYKAHWSVPRMQGSTGEGHPTSRYFNHNSLIRAGRINPCQICYVVRPSPFSRPLLLLPCRSSAPGSVRQSRWIAPVDSSGIRLPTPARRHSRRKTVRPVSTGTRCPMCAVRWVSSSPAGATPVHRRRNHLGVHNPIQQHISLK